MTNEQKQAFLRLATALSPENLFCDGEVSIQEGKRRARRIVKEWRALEKKVGRRVSESEVWDGVLARTW